MAIHMQCAQRPQQRGALRPLSPQGWQHQPDRFRRGQAFRHGIGQHGVRADLKKMRLSCGDHRVNGGCKEHALPHVAPPVLRVVVRALGQLSGDGGENFDAARPGLQTCQRFGQFLPHRVHVGAVKRIVHRHVAHKKRPLLHRLENFIHRIAVTRDGHHLGAVHRRERGSLSIRGDEGLGLLSRQRCGDHLAAQRCLLHAPPAVVNHTHRLRQRQRAAHMRRSDLPHAMSYHSIGAHTPGLPQRRQPHLQGKERRLRDLCFVQPRGRFITTQFIQQRAAAELEQLIMAGLDDLAEHRFLLQQLSPHRPPLRPLAAEDKDEPGVFDWLPNIESGSLLAAQIGRQRGAHPRARACHGRETKFMVRASAARRGADLAQREGFIRRLQKIVEGLGDGHQRGI